MENIEKVQKSPHSGQNSSTCTGTGKRCTGTPYSGFPVSTSFRILVINCSFLI